MKKKVLGGLLAVSMIATMGAFKVSVSAAVLCATLSFCHECLPAAYSQYVI